MNIYFISYVYQDHSTKKSQFFKSPVTKSIIVIIDVATCLEDIRITEVTFEVKDVFQT